MKSYSGRRRAVRRPQFQPGQAVCVFLPRHRDKLTSRYSEPQVIKAQTGPATYEFSDGRRWNAAKLAKAPVNVQQRHNDDFGFDWDDDDFSPITQSMHFYNSSTSNATSIPVVTQPPQRDFLHDPVLVEEPPSPDITPVPFPVTEPSLNAAMPLSVLDPGQACAQGPGSALPDPGQYSSPAVPDDSALSRSKTPSSGTASSMQPLEGSTSECSDSIGPLSAPLVVSAPATLKDPATALTESQLVDQSTRPDRRNTSKTMCSSLVLRVSSIQ
ncbi:unnamed protein product, partial [Ixodes persulcatus]